MPNNDPWASSIESDSRSAWSRVLGNGVLVSGAFLVVPALGSRRLSRSREA